MLHKLYRKLHDITIQILLYRHYFITNLYCNINLFYDTLHNYNGNNFMVQITQYLL